MNAATPLLELDKLAVSFDGHAAVHPIDLAIERGEMLALVGESGSGKSTIALATMGLLPSQARVQGAIRFEGQSLLGQREREWSALRGNRVSMIFQEPMTSLNPLQPIGRCRRKQHATQHSNCSTSCVCQSRHAASIRIRTNCPAASGNA
jgi:peptide/nickel transport system ATP-binding protein